MTTDYNASSIKVMTEQALSEKHIYLKREELARYYKLPIEHIDRLIEACELSGEDWQKVESKYLEKNSDIQLIPEFQECFKELIKRNA